MRILIIAGTPSNYKSIKGGYNSGGWIAALENQLVKLKEIELAVCFHLADEPFKVVQGVVTYYPMPVVKENKLKKIIYGIVNKSTTYEESLWGQYYNLYHSVVQDFKPDLIQVFGSEAPFGLVSDICNIPVVLHIQGLLNPIFNALMPYNVSWRDYIHCCSIRKLYGRYMMKKTWEQNCYRELHIMSNIHYFLGRTEWDRRCLESLQNNYNYYKCNEILRNEFYTIEKRNNPNSFKIISVGSGLVSKGFDVILKCANVLKNYFKVEFEWNVYGNINSSYFEKITGIRACNVNVILRGVANAGQLKNSILNSTVYYHPSYIENSPNSLCEAQILGCPVVGTYVGGIPSLIKDGITGFLVPANDPYQSASILKELFCDRTLNERIGSTGKREATERHNPETIALKLVKTYTDILDSKLV